MRRAIRLPNGEQCGLGVYVRAWRSLLSLPGEAQIKGWEHFPTEAKHVLADLRTGMHDRINRHDPTYGRGRKWDARWQIDCRRDARIVNEYAAHRVVHPVNRLSTPELQRRFQWAHSTVDGVSVRLYSRRRAA